MTLKHTEVRERLIEATLKAMDKAGLDGIKARDLARAADVSVGTVYNLFGNVDRLIREANLRIYAQLNALGHKNLEKQAAAFVDAVAAGQLENAPRDKIRFHLLGLARLYLGFVEENAKRWSALLAFNRSRAAAFESMDYAETPEVLIGIVADLLHEAIDDEDQRKATAWALWSSVHGIVTMNYVGQFTEEARNRAWEQIEIIVTLAVDGMFAGPRGT